VPNLLRAYEGTRSRFPVRAMPGNHYLLRCIRRVALFDAIDAGRIASSAARWCLASLAGAMPLAERASALTERAADPVWTTRVRRT
jgi:hypothetical protein